MTSGGGGERPRGDWPFRLPATPGAAFDAIRKAAQPFVPDQWLLGPAAAIRALAAAARTTLVGRPVTFVIGERTVRLRLRDLVAEPSDLGAVVGQFDDLRLHAADVQWDGGAVEELRVVARNVHLRPGVPVVLVAAPVDVEAVVGVATVTSWLPTGNARVDLGGDGVARVGVAGGRGTVEVDLRIEGSLLRIAPQAASAFGRRTRVVRRLPALHVTVPELPTGLRVTELVVADGSIRVRGVVEEWREPLSVGQLTTLTERLRASATEIVVPRTPPPA